MVTQLAQDAINETFETNFQNAFSYSVHNLVVSTVAKELVVDKVEYDVHEGEKVRASAVGELTRSLIKVNLLTFSIVCFFQNLI